MDARATRRGLNCRDGRDTQEVVGGQLLEALRHHAQKKSFVASERDEAARASYRNEIDNQNAQTLVFIDETSAYVGTRPTRAGLVPVLGQSREYGWAASRERVYDPLAKGKKARVSLVAAISLNGAMAEQALVITDTVNKNAFLAFLETTLLPTLAKGSVLVMDNWSAKHPERTVHRLGQNGRYRACPPGEEVRELVERFGCSLLYLPTYSPDLNPIEHLFAKVKAFVKSLRPDSTDKLSQAFCDAVKTLTQENILKSFLHCGYRL